MSIARPADEPEGARAAGPNAGGGPTVIGWVQGLLSLGPPTAGRSEWVAAPEGLATWEDERRAAR